MAPLVYADQSADALQLTLIDGWFDPTQFRILERASIAWGAVEVDAGVIGQSHYLAVRGGGVGLTEVVACTPVEAARARRFRSLRRLRGTLSAGPVGGAAGYRFRVKRCSAVSGRPLVDRLEAAARATARSGGGIGLVCRFPAGPDGAEARTVVCARPAAGRLDVRTVHVYPNGQTSVFTRSVIRLP